MGNDFTLGVEINRKTRCIGIANLSYHEISLIFEFLDADTLLMIHRKSKDVSQTFPNDQEAVGKKYRPSKCGTPSFFLPAYLRIPIYRAVTRNLALFEPLVVGQTQDEFIAQLK